MMGAGHTLGTLGALTTILRVRAERRLASALSALEFSAMLGILGGVTLPGALAWQTAFLVACSPILVALVALKAVLALLPDDGGDRPWFARSAAAVESHVPAGDRATTALAFAAGGAVALAYSTLEQFLIPVRGSREFGLERSGIAHLLMLAQLCDTFALLPVGALADRPRAAAVGRDRLRRLRSQHGGLDAAGRAPALGHSRLAGRVAHGALPRLRRRRDVPWALRQRAPRRHPSPRTPG